jgi:hypothetical protein
MVEERVTTYETPADRNTTTVIHEGPARSSSGAGWLFGIVLLIAVLAVVYLMVSRSDSEAVKDNAIANAASEVGDAASKVGTAAENAADNLTTK